MFPIHTVCETGQRPPSSYCGGTCVGVPLNQPAAYPITTNTAITAITPYHRRLSIKFIVTSRYPAMHGDPAISFLDLHFPI